MDPSPERWEILRSRHRDLLAGDRLTCTSGAVWVLVVEGALRVQGLCPEDRLGAGDAALMRRPSLHVARADGAARVIVVELRRAGLAPGADVEVVRDFARDQAGVVALLTVCPLAAEDGRPTDDPAAGFRPAYGQLLAAAMRAGELDAVTADGTSRSVTCMDPAVRAVALAVAREPARAWTLPLLSREAMLGRTALSERFRESLGVPPMRFVRRVRAERAAEVLRSTDRTVTSVAFAVGYGSTAAFVRAFVAEMGQTPGTWRRSARRSAERAGSDANPAAPTIAANPPSRSAEPTPA